MVIDVVFKTPDAVEIALVNFTSPDGENSTERTEAKEFIEQYVKYNEIIKIRFDTTEKTATVLKCR